MTDDDRRALINLMAATGHLMRISMAREDELKADAARHARDVGLALEDYHDEHTRALALLKALEDIALYRVPPLSFEYRCDPEKLANAFRDHAKAAVAAYDHDSRQEPPTLFFKGPCVAIIRRDKPMGEWEWWEYDPVQIGWRKLES